MSRSKPDLPSPPFDDCDELKAAAPRQEEVVASSELLGASACVAIDHLGTRYILRATRSGKLILTK